MSDGYDLQVRIWEARRLSRPGPDTPAASPWVLYLHGIQSHGGWFEWSASVLAEAGLNVVLPDRRGSGLNPQARGDSPSVQRWLKDLDELAVVGERRFGQRAPGVVGVSWGGKLALAWSLRCSPQPRLLLIAPGIFPAVDVGWRARLRIAAALLFSPAKPFLIPLSDPALFTDNPCGREFIAGDSLKLTHATARFLYHSSRLDAHLRRMAPGALTAALTLLLARRDAIIRNEPTERWLRSRCSQPLRVEMFDSAHTLEFDAGAGAFAARLQDWAGELRCLTTTQSTSR